jgi:hypothetical protein
VVVGWSLQTNYQLYVVGQALRDEFKDCWQVDIILALLVW